MRKLAIMALTVLALAGLSGTAIAETAKAEVTVGKSGIKVSDAIKSGRDKAVNCCNEPAEEM